ncbi:MAG: NAD-dependent epimerase/dehydratase family protein [Acidimicrobiia bacterium]
MTTVVVTGAASALGRAVCELAAADPEVDEVVAVDRRAVAPTHPKVRSRVADLATGSLAELFESGTEVLHLAQSTRLVPRPDDLPDADLVGRVLEGVEQAGVEHVVLMSSAAAYGAWANNPVPLTEDAPLRPNPGVVHAAEKAEVERLAREWRDARPGRTATLVRPAPVVADDHPGWLARALSRGPVPVSDVDPPAQFLHLDDLASAVDLARRAHLDGPRNVAPDGWIPGETVRALAGGPRLRLPERAALKVARARWRWHLAPTPPELLPYTVHPWVVANDRIKAEGWQPRRSNEEAFVAAHRAGPLSSISPRRRQELALGASAAGVVALGAGLVGLVRQRTRRPG